MLTRRKLMTATMLATSVGLDPLSASAVPAASRPPRVAVEIDGRVVDRSTVLEWEARRLQVAAERLAHHLPGALVAELETLLRRRSTSADNIARDRRLLAEVKLKMGAPRIRQLVAPDLVVTDRASTLAASLNRWSVSSAELSSTVGTARGFVSWFNARGDRNDHRAMLVACPDHYLIHNPRPGVQEVIEVTGGAILASRFVIDYSDSIDVPLRKDTRYPVRIVGWARANGARIGAVHHQFRDDPRGGFRAKLAVAFPSTLPPWMISEHRWHLACEFSNWVTAYAASNQG